MLGDMKSNSVNMTLAKSFICFLVTLLLSTVAATRDRTCCSYACKSSIDSAGGYTNTCPDWCRNQDSCVLRNKSGIVTPGIDGCTVKYDSKYKNSDQMTREQCLEENFVGQQQLGSGDDSLPFYVVAYPFKDSNQFESHFTGIDFRYLADNLSRLHFRIKNTNNKVCPSKEEQEEAKKSDIHHTEGTTCKPRCVEINLNNSVLSNLKGTYLSHDCEAGFYVQHNNWISSSLHDYQLSVCADSSCGNYMFQLPDSNIFSEDIDEVGLVLLDLNHYEKNDIIVLWIPNIIEADQFNLQVFRMIDNETDIEVVHNENVTKDTASDLQRISLSSLSLSSGRYQVKVTPIISGTLMTDRALQSVYLTRPSYSQRALAAITAILFTVLLVGVILSLYKQWQTVAEQGAVEPGALIAAGRMKHQSVLIITPLDNPDHVEIVQLLCRYLKDWCGVDTTYFAFDEATGIGVSQNDPWKWCQETGDKVKDNGHVVYIAGPDPSLSNNISIFPNLEDNQAFVTTKHLQTMDREGRVLVTRFAYSSMKTIPKEVPEHLKASSFILPKQMNEFLVQLLGVKKKPLCSLLPCDTCNIVKPEIKPGNLSRGGGEEILSRVHELCLKDTKHKQAIAQNINSNPKKVSEAPILKRDSQNVAETAALLTKEIENFNNLKSDKTLKIDLEPNLPSVKQMEERDRLDVE